ncbi:MAG: response regulator [Anaerolineaceae bacterium]|nr:response regulator [Anaerolineaceae bacterium]
MNSPVIGKALIVDDDTSWQAILVEILEEIGLEVQVADQADAALKIINAETLHLLIADLSLSSEDHRNQDGVTILDAAKRKIPACVSILLTGYATVELSVQVLREYGAYTCLRKENFHRKEFRNLISQALNEIDTSQSAASQTEDLISADTDGAHESSEDESQASKGRVLLVEDDSGWRSILQEILEDEGYLVRPCTSFGQAHGLLLHETFHLAIIDLNLSPNRFVGKTISESFKDAYPEGYRLLQLIRVARIPVFVVSGEQRIQAIEDVYRVFNINGYFEKQNFERRLFLNEISQAVVLNDLIDNKFNLTERELQVMELLVEGKENKEIAEILFISPNTVKRHIKSVFSKMEVHSRAAAVAAYLSVYTITQQK